MEINAQLKYAHIAPRKMRLVADIVKGRDVVAAELVLSTLVKRSAAPVLRLLKSATANAMNNFQLDESSLYVKDIKVNAGPVVKRMMPRAFGRGATIRKRMSHVVLVLEQREQGSVPADKTRRAKDQSVRPNSRSGGPVVRDAEAQDLKVDAAVRERGDGRTQSLSVPRRKRSFVPKMFQRKAI